VLRLEKVIEGFEEGGRLDWLHPCHGRFPDFAALYSDSETEYVFEVLVWEDTNQWVAAVVGSDAYHNGYPRSYRWVSQGNGTAVCNPTKGDTYDVDLPKLRKEKHIAYASIHVHMITEPNKG